MTNNPLLQQRAAPNPYLSAAGLLINRLAWDVRPEALRSRRRLDLCRDEHAGRKAVIMCNGPSLLETDFDLLHRSGVFRSEEQTSELQSLMSISYAVFCLKKKK